MAQETKVPIKNIYYMLCYAWNVIDYSDKTICGEEEFDNIYNLLARMLIKEVSLLIKRGFHRDYINETEATSKLKGQILITESIAQLTHLKKQMVCSFDDYSENVPMNKIIKSTLMDMLKYANLDKTLGKRIRSLLTNFNNVDYITVNKEIFSSLKFNKNNLNYRMMINICKLFRYGLIANQNDKIVEFTDFIDQNQMQKVYELFILNFYKKHLDNHKYHVHAPKIKWRMDEEIDEELEGLFDVDENPGDRRTDIVIENKEDNIQFIIDAKYYKEMMVSSYMNEEAQTYRVSHLNQVRGYVLDSNFSGKKYGALVYPSINNDNEYEKGKLIPISGSNIIMKMLNLNKEWNDISTDLLSFATKVVK